MEAHPKKDAAGRIHNKLEISILECIPTPLFFINKEHRIGFWNKACEELTGFTAKEMEGSKKQWIPFYSQERPLLADLIIDRDTDAIRFYYEDKNLRPSDLIPGAYEAEDFFHNLGGKDRYLRFLAAPALDEMGEVTGALVTIQDITRLVKLEEAAQRYTSELELNIWDKTRELQISKDRYQMVIRSCREGIAIVRDGEIVWANPKFPEIFGYDAKKIIHMELAKLIDPESRTSFLSLIHQGSEKELSEYSDYEFKGIRKDGMPIYLESNIIPFFYGSDLATMLFVWDITEKKQFQYLLNRAQEEKARSIARDLHDGVGQQLLSIHVNLEALKSKISPSQSSSILKELSFIDQAMEEAIEEIRRISMDLRPPLLDKLGFIPALEELINNFSLNTRIHIEHFLPDRSFSLPKHVEINLYRIIQEALNNISKHADSHKAVIKLIALGDRLLVTIKDFGKGFSINDPNLRKAGKGIGLLTLTERVRIINGRLKIQSQPGGGTTIHIDIPLTGDRHFKP